MCELCGFDATYYGDDLRLVEGVTICVGCYLELSDSGFGYPDSDHLLNQFALEYVRAA
jgi:hypothetical protein